MISGVMFVPVQWGKQRGRKDERKDSPGTNNGLSSAKINNHNNFDGTFAALAFQIMELYLHFQSSKLTLSLSCLTYCSVLNFEKLSDSFFPFSCC